MITPEEYKKAGSELERLRQEHDEKSSKIKEEEESVTDKYYKIKREISEKEYQELDKLKKEKLQEDNDYNKKTEPHGEKIVEFSKVIDFIKVSKEKRDLNIEVYFYDYPRDEKGEVIRTENRSYPEKEKVFIKPISVLRDDDFCRIGIYIYKNRKPVNKYTLCLIGRSIFKERMLEFNRGGYLYDINENGDFKKVLKESPEEKELIAFFQRNEKRIFKEGLKKIDETIKEHLEVLKIKDSKEWEIAYLEHRKDYYENSYSHGTETPEYLEIINKLIELTDGEEKQKYSEIIKRKLIEGIKE